MLKSAKNIYKLVINPQKDLFRWKVDAYPAFIFAFAYGMANPSGWPKSEIIFIGKNCFWWNNWSDIDSQGQICLKKQASLVNGDFKSSYYRLYRNSFKSLDKEFARINRLDLSSLSLNDFRQTWFKFFQVFFEFSRIVIIPEVMAYAVSRKLERNIAKYKHPLAPEEISRLTTFPEKSFLMEEEYELLKIRREKNRLKRKRLIKRHSQKFIWLLNGYHGVQVLDEAFFGNRLDDLIKSRPVGNSLNHFKNYSSGVKLNFRRLVKKYNLDGRTIRLAKLTQRSSYLQDDRKRKQLETMIYINKLYKELANRLNISLERSFYINFIEFDYFIKNKNSLSELKKRQKNFRLTLTWFQPEFSTVKVAELQKLLDQAYVGKQGKEVKGVVAQPGKVMGTVKIVKNLAGISDFKNNQILVAQMTSPDYIAAIKKARAIVTDDGGLTCHAAIVARELKKPCIVGTRNATRLLHDGDLVEVDADRGVVIKI